MAFLCPTPHSRLLSRSNAHTFPLSSCARRRPQCSHPTSTLPSTVVKTIDPTTASSLYVVGCVHGSYVSAADVRAVIDTTDPDAVVLELCPARMATLRNLLRNTAPGTRISASMRAALKNRTFSQVRETFNGTPQAILATVLESAYALQTFSGLDPGIEFAYPLRSLNSSQLICGDAPAQHTVQGLYRAFTSPLTSIRLARSAAHEIFHHVIRRPPGGVNSLAIVLTEPGRLAEIFRLFVPTALVTLALTTLVSVIVGIAAHLLESTSVVSTLAAQTSASASPTAWGLLAIASQVMFITYFSVSLLHFMKVLVSDRDIILAQSILDTAAYYSQLRKRSVTVVAVVGLLHVNGILRVLEKVENVDSS